MEKTLLPLKPPFAHYKNAVTSSTSTLANSCGIVVADIMAGSITSNNPRLGLRKAMCRS
jgi:hypothetical protein